MQSLILQPTSTTTGRRVGVSTSDFDLDAELGFEIDPVTAAAYASAVLEYGPCRLGDCFLREVDLSQGAFRVSMLPSDGGAIRWGGTGEWAPSSPKEGPHINRGDTPVHRLIQQMLAAPGDLLLADVPFLTNEASDRTWEPPSNPPGHLKRERRRATSRTTS